MNQVHDVIVVECDAAVQAVYPYEGPIEHVRGRGGTNFRPALEANFLKETAPDVVVYFTDGHGPAPAVAPTIPVVWCLTVRGVKPAPWGGEIRMTSR